METVERWTALKEFEHFLRNLPPAIARTSGTCVYLRNVIAPHRGKNADGVLEICDDKYLEMRRTAAGKVWKMKKESIDLENISGGTGGANQYYCVQGYSKKYGGNVKLYVSTYEDAVKLCQKLELGTECISKVKN